MDDVLPSPEALVKNTRKGKKRSNPKTRHTAAELRAMERRGKSKTDWKAATKKPLPSGRDPGDSIEEIDWATTELPLPRPKKP